MSPKDACLTSLKDQVLRMELAPGEVLDEATLCAAHGLSRTPLREVLQRLAGEGYVTLTSGRGATVASMDLPRMRMFFQTAPLIYASTARLAAEQAGPGLDALKATQRQFRAAAQGGEASAAAVLNHDFHAQIGAMAENPYLEAALGRLLIDHTRLSQTFYRPETDTQRGKVQQACDDHDAMIAAIEDRNAAEAVALTLRHWDLSRDSLDRFVRPDPLPHDIEGLRDAV
ncbi:MAG: GntR family transcriptional regulator [Pseudomonadota bacterium]